MPVSGTYDSTVWFVCWFDDSDEIWITSVKGTPENKQSFNSGADNVAQFSTEAEARVKVLELNPDYDFGDE